SSGAVERRRHRTSQTIARNVIYRVIFCQCNDNHLNLHSFPTRRSSDLKQGPTDLTGKAELSGAMSCGPLVRPWDTNNVWSAPSRSEEHTSELQSRREFVCRLRLEKRQ